MEVVKFLILKVNCDPKSRNSANATPLHVAIHNGHLNVTRFFISDQNCDKNTFGGRYGRTPLHILHVHVLTLCNGCALICGNLNSV